MRLIFDRYPQKALPPHRLPLGENQGLRQWSAQFLQHFLDSHQALFRGQTRTEHLPVNQPLKTAEWTKRETQTVSGCPKPSPNTEKGCAFWAI